MSTQTTTSIDSKKPANKQELIPLLDEKRVEMVARNQGIRAK